MRNEEIINLIEELKSIKPTKEFKFELKNKIMERQKTYKFTRKLEDGTKEVEEVKPERWGWGVVYKDGTELHQFGEDGVFHQFKEIDFDKVKMFAMMNLEDPNKFFYLPISDDIKDRIKIFHFYRKIRPTGHDSFITVYVFGYKFKGSNEYDEEGNVKSQNAAYHFILPDDRIITSPVDNLDLTKFGVMPKKDN